MKTFLKIFIIISIFYFNMTQVAAKIPMSQTHPINNTSDHILEQITPKFKNKTLKEINTTITIPSNYNEQEIIIAPKVFRTLKEYNFKHSYNVDLKITIKNNSQNKYTYLNNSYIIQTDDLKRYGIDENFDFVYNLKGFDQRDILASYKYNLTANDALKSLYNNHKIDISKLNKLLKKKNYKNLATYYLDYYNHKYNSNYQNINDFNIEVMDEIFTGKLLKKKIYNKDLIRLTYNYFYNKDLTIDHKSIGDYMNNQYNLENFTINNKEKYKIKTIKISTKKLYFYKTDVYMEFKLSKV